MNLLINLLIIGVIAYLIFWLISSFMPEPIKRIALIVFAVVCIIYLLGMLTGQVPGVYGPTPHSVIK